MQPLGLNLATRPFRNNVLLWLAYGIAVVGLGGFSWYSVSTWLDHRAWLAELRSEVDTSESRIQNLRLRAETADRGIEAYDLESLGIQAAKANEIIEWKAFSWTELFNRLAELQPYDVKMTEVRPVFRGREFDDGRNRVTANDRLSVPVLVEGLGKNFASLLEFQNALFADSRFGRVEPQRMQRTRETREIAFTLGFLYYPDADAPDEAPEAAPGEASAEAAVPDAEDAPAADEAGPETAVAVEVGDPGFAGDAAAADGEVESATAPAGGAPPPAARPAASDGAGARPPRTARTAREENR